MNGEVYGEHEPCEDCGRPKSEYVDLGTHGVFRCWWCEERTGPNVWLGVTAALERHAVVEGIDLPPITRVTADA